MSRSKSRITISAVAATLIASVSAAAAADLKAGRQMAAARCQVCHGIDGIATLPIAPNLAGESAIYLQTQLKAYRSGAREQEMMTVVAKDLSDTDIQNLAAWYEAIKITATLPE